MKSTMLAGALAASLALTGCGTIGRIVHVVTAPTTRLDEGKAYLAAEGVYDAAVVTADRAVNTGLLPPAKIHALKRMIDQGHRLVLTGRAALKLGAAPDLASAATALKAVAAEINALMASASAPGPK